MRRDSGGESSSMLGCQNSSPELPKNHRTFKSRRKLPFSENFESPSVISDPDSNDSLESRPKISSSSKSLTPRRSTPLSERQQIALLCKLSAKDQTLAEKSPNFAEENFGLSSKRNERGETPLHVATIKGDTSKVRQLLKEGAHVNATDFAGWTPLHEACNHGWLEIAKLLIKYGADVNASGLDKITPLHDAAVNKHEKIVSLLLKHGADPLQKNASKKTPYDVARSPEVSNVLKSAIYREQEQFTKEEAAAPYQDHLRTPEAVGKRQSENSPCHPIQALCEPTMRKNSSQSQTHKGAEKPTSPRLTLRFQSIKSRDDKSTSSAKVTDISTPQPKYQSYCVTMEAKGDVYDFRKEDAVVSSTQNLSSHNENEGTSLKFDAVSSTSNKDTEECGKESAEELQESVKSVSVEKMDTTENTVKANGGRAISDSNTKEKESSDAEKEEIRRKRRKSNDSVQSRHSTSRGHKSPSSKCQPDSHNDQKSPKARKRGSLSSSDTESNPSDAEAMSAEAAAESGSFNGSSSNANPHSPKVPPLKIVIPSGTGSLELETRERSKVSSSNKPLPYVVNTTTSDTIDTDSISESFSGDGVREGSKPDLCNKSKDENHPPEERFQRVTRSSQRMQAAMSGTTPNQCHNAESTQNVVSSSSQKGDASGESSNDEQMQIQVDVHPRKRKMRTKENTNENGSQNPSCASSSSEDSPQQHQLLNCYQMFLDIRKQVDKRRRGMFIVQPKPPNGYEHYLLNRCSYVLEGNAASRLSVPMISPPQSLEGSIKELFVEQEKERYKLRLQHLIEREKLVLSVEQEILRVHGRAARAMSNQTVPLSVCTILKDEEIYNVIEDDKDKNVRSRYNGRLFLSWLQDVDDKWEKIKGAMLLRHHNEAESLHAVQKLDWEWKMKELAMCEMKTSPVIDDIFVPIVHVSDDFDLLPT